jgi:hypothetical protein
MTNLLKAIILILLISGCSPQKRLNRLERKHPELFRVDTIFKVDTFKFEGVKLDTIFKHEITTDTITIIKDNVILRYFNDGKTVYLAGETKTIEKIIKYPIQVKAAVIRETVTKIPFWIYILGSIMVITILLLALKR